jgi:signal transduction histidine kinase
MANTFLILAFVLNMGLGSLVYWKSSPYRRVNISFSIFSWACAEWAISILMIYSLKNPVWKTFWVRMSFVGPSVIAGVFLYFSLIFPREKRKIGLAKIVIILFPSLIFATLSFTKAMVNSVDWERVSADYGLAHKLFAVYFFISMSAGIFSLMKSFKNSVGLERVQIKYCFLGIFTTFFPAITSNLLLPSLGTSKLSHLGPSFMIIMVSFITYAILKYRLLDINIVFKKGTTYVLLLLLLFVPSAILMLLSQEFFFKEIDYLFSAIILSLLILVAFLFHQIKPGTEKAVEHLLFKNKYDYRETLGKFSKAMVSILNLQSLAKRIIETIAQTMGVEKASLFLLDEEKGGYYLIESKNIKMATPTPLLLKEDPLPHYLQKIRDIIVREELIREARKPELNSVINKMSLLEAEVSIPLVSRGQLIGMINLSHKFNRDIYSYEDIELLGTLANQTAIAIENSWLYEDLKKSKSYIRRADRLASLGTLTAALAHEIRNPLVAIKTFIQLLPERLEDEEFRKHFLSIASGEVDRISSLVSELLEFARTSDPKLEMEDVNNILDGMILLSSTESKKKHIEIVKDYSQDLPPVSIDREQIKQVFLNILLNAIEATPENGKITVETRSFVKPGGEAYIQIRFTDTGCGIPKEHLEDIFNPFFTTKNKGSGLGLSISHQIVQDHKGYIDVESELDRGSSFFINLPLSQDHPKRRMDDFENQGSIFNSY